MKKFPIQYNNYRGTIEYIPFEMMLEHEEQCLKNHGQSVQRLAERFGTDYLETYYILNDSKYKNHKSEDLPRLIENARRVVHAMSYEWLMKNKKLDLGEV